LPFALNIAARAGAALHVAFVHVPDTFGESSAHWQDLDAGARNDEAKYLATLCQRLCDASPAKIELHHLEGIVPETLAEEVAERNVDLVVINAHGWGYISRAMVGSVSDYLMRHLHVPLLVVHAPPDTRPDVSRQIALRRVLIPLDGSALAESILRPARSLGELWQAEYELLRVVSPPRSLLGAWSEEPPGVQEQLLGSQKHEASTYLEALAERLRAESLKVNTHVVVGRSPASAILAEARAAECDVIAIATHGRGGLPRLLWGSVADKVIRGAHSAVLVFNNS
jgi:nucleotide-binding universal stress UspA family protein